MFKNIHMSIMKRENICVYMHKKKNKNKEYVHEFIRRGCKHKKKKNKNRDGLYVHI